MPRTSFRYPTLLRLALVEALLLALFAAASPAQEPTPLIEPVTDAEILDPPASDWLMFRGNLANWGYSPLDEIDRDNVNQLDFAWSFTMEEGPIESTPLVRNGILYLPNPGDVIHAIDAATGDMIWEYRRELPEEVTEGPTIASIVGVIKSLLMKFLTHVPPHIATASKLVTGLPVADIFKEGATSEETK